MPPWLRPVKPWCPFLSERLTSPGHHPVRSHLVLRGMQAQQFSWVVNVLCVRRRLTAQYSFATSGCPRIAEWQRNNRNYEGNEEFVTDLMRHNYTINYDTWYYVQLYSTMPWYMYYDVSMYEGGSTPHPSARERPSSWFGMTPKDPR